MKHQYFGDISDFHKYALLQTLCGKGELRLGVCWMLTPDDGKNDGRRIAYLDAPEKWRPYNPDLFDLLKACLKNPQTRNVSSVELRGLLPRAEFCSEKLGDSGLRRRRYFNKLLKRFAKTDLLFFDPDNGLEVDSVPFGARNSSKYLYWSEVSEVFGAKHSLLIYQHFRREERNRFIASLAAKLSGRTGATEIHSFRTPHVVFLLVPRKEHTAYFRHASARVEDMWAGQFEVRHHRSG
jgi:hypothetical protein